MCTTLAWIIITDDLQLKGKQFSDVYIHHIYLTSTIWLGYLSVWNLGTSDKKAKDTVNIEFE